MTKKDYQLIADVFAACQDKTRSELVDALARALKKDNPRFDPTKFQRACDKRGS